MLSCLSILFTVIVTARKRFSAEELEDAVQTIYPMVANFKNKEKPVDNSFSVDTSPL